MKFVKDTRDNSEKWVTVIEEKMNDFYEEIVSVKKNLAGIIKNTDKIVDDVQETIDDVISETVEDIVEPEEKPKEKPKKRSRKNS